jgi:hypothetical protein
MRFNMKLSRLTNSFIRFLTPFGAHPGDRGPQVARAMAWLPRLGVFLFCAGVLAPEKAAAEGCAAPPANLISWWRAENNAVDALDINNGTLQGGVTFAAGEVGQAFSFDGGDSAVQIPDSASLDFATNAPMTIELWAYRTGAETTMYLLGKRDANCGSVQYEIGFDPYNGLSFTVGNGSVATGVQMPLNTWMHLAATFNGVHSLAFYTNGTLAATGIGNLGPSNSAPLIIGNSSICAGFTGLIDEVSIYSNDLSAAKIQSIYAAGSSGKCFAPPSVTAQPQDQTVLLGETVTFSVAASGGTPPYSYQWLVDGANLSGATSNTLVLTNVQTSQAANYSVIVRALGASVLSSNALLTVVTPVPEEVVVLDQAGLLSGLAAGGDVTFAGDGTIVLSQTVVISQDTILDGSGHNVTISGNNAVQVFSVGSGVQFTLKNLTIVNGFSTGGAGVGATAGALFNGGGTVNVVQCGFVGNSAVGSAGGNGGNASGGAIYNNLGFINITNSSFLHNNATGGAIGNGATNGGSSFGGAICNNGGSINLVGSTFLDNSSVGGYGGTGLSGSAFGGAVHNDGGTLNLIGTMFTGNNSASGSVVGIENGPYGVGGGSFGGALATMAGNVTVTNGGFYINDASSPAVGADPGGCTAGPAFGGGIYQASGTLNLIDTTLATNGAFGGSSLYFAHTANGYGGGLFNAGTLNATNSNFYGNNASGGSGAGGDGFPAPDAYGGAIFNQGTANVMDTTLSGNEALGGFGGRGLGNVPLASGGGNGGGIFNSNVLLLLGSTLSQNTAVGQASIGSLQAGLGGSSFGGGIFNLGICFATNDTIVGNSAIGGSPVYNAGGSANGGGLFNQGGTVTVAYLTIYSNSANGGLGSPNGPGVGGGINATNGTLLLLDSIVAGNPSGSDFYGTFGALTDGGDNLSSDISFPFSAPGSMNNTDPELGLLGHYGGPTQTVPLLAGSPAIDAAGAGGCPATDQRGIDRPSGGACDIGAFEYAPSFSIQGQVRGFGPIGIITVSAGGWSSVTDSQGNYILNDVVAGTYTVMPSSSISGVNFSPSNQIISVGPNATNVNFITSLLNTLNVGGYSNGVLQLAFAGTNGQTEVVQVSTNLINWIPVSTNVLGSNGVLSFSLTNSGAQPIQFIRTQTP